jgi:hypothetical protein
LTLWELAAAIDGHNKAQGGDVPMEAPSDDEFEQMLEAYDHSQATEQ